MDYERPSIRALVSFPLREEPEWWTDPGVVTLELAAELVTRGYIVLVDPADERDLAMWEILNRRAPKKAGRKWFMPPD